MPSTNNWRMSIGSLAKDANVSVETIRFYQRRGLLAEPTKPVGGIRRYGPTELARLRFVKSAQRLGFSLDEILELLKLDDGANCAAVSDLAIARLDDVRARISALSQMEAALAALVSECSASHRDVRCPLIDALQREP